MRLYLVARSTTVLLGCGRVLGCGSHDVPAVVSIPLAPMSGAIIWACRATLLTCPLRRA